MSRGYRITVKQVTDAYNELKDSKEVLAKAQIAHERSQDIFKTLIKRASQITLAKVMHSEDFFD